jgi:antitoxin HicB
MQTLTYFAKLEPDEDGSVIVSFPDVPEALTAGDDRDEALSNAADALGVALLAILDAGRELPVPTTRGGGLAPITPSAQDAAKLAVISAWRESGLSKVAFAKRLGVDERAARKILDPREATKLPALEAALRALGKRLVISVEAA